MAVFALYFSIFIPIEKIETCKSIGGFKGLLELKKEEVGKKVWFDDHLYRDGAMSRFDIDEMIDFWEKQGLAATGEVDGQTVWKDFCVMNMLGETRFPCDWLEVEMGNFPNQGGLLTSVYMKGFLKSEIVFPDSIKI